MKKKKDDTVDKLEGASLSGLQEELEHMRLLIIDEKVHCNFII